MPEEELAPEDILLVVETQIPEQLSEEESVTDAVQIEAMPDCSSDFLKIDSFLPNPQKGEAIEAAGQPPMPPPITSTSVSITLSAKPAIIITTSLRMILLLFSPRAQVPPWLWHHAPQQVYSQSQYPHIVLF